MKKHKWEKASGRIIYYDKGKYHDGPKCSVCGFTFCRNCNPEGYKSPCPSKSIRPSDKNLAPFVVALGKALRTR